MQFNEITRQQSKVSNSFDMAFYNNYLHEIAYKSEDIEFERKFYCIFYVKSADSVNGMKALIFNKEENN